MTTICYSCVQVVGGLPKTIKRKKGGEAGVDKTPGSRIKEREVHVRKNFIAAAIVERAVRACRNVFCVSVIHYVQLFNGYVASLSKTIKQITFDLYIRSVHETVH